MQEILHKNLKSGNDVLYGPFAYLLLVGNLAVNFPFSLFSGSF